MNKMMQLLKDIFAKLIELKADTEEFIEFLIEKLPEIHAEFVEKTNRMFGTLMFKSSNWFIADENKVKAIDLFKLKANGGDWDYVYIENDTLRAELEKEYERRPLKNAFYEFTEKITHANIKATAEKHNLMRYFNPREARDLFDASVTLKLLIKGKNGLLVYSQTESGLWFRFNFWLNADGKAKVNVNEVNASFEWYPGFLVPLCDMPSEPLVS